ncbi:MAG: PilZ domain-containing protein [Pseudoxanthomonas sp.]
MNTRAAQRAPRRPATTPMPVADVMTGQPLGRVGNLSESGMLLVASQPLVEDALYQLQFVLPGTDGRRETVIDVGVHVVWMGRANAPGQAFAGLRFLTIDAAQQQAIRDWVAAGAARA